jgi:hypothetical protein
VRVLPCASWAAASVLPPCRCCNRVGAWRVACGCVCREPFSRLTFGAYLVHPMIISVIYQSMVEFHRYTHIQIAVNFVAVLFLTYAAAAVLFLAVEKPFMNMEAIVFKRLGLMGGSSE